MPRTLGFTQKRQKWLTNRTTKLLGAPLRQPITHEHSYARKLDRLVDEMTREVSRAVKKLFRSDESKARFAEDASISSTARILLNQLTRKFEKKFSSRASIFAKAMTSKADQSSKSTMFGSLKKLSGGLSIKTDYLTEDLKDILKASISENVDLINSIPKTYMEQIKGEVMRTITQPEQGGIVALQEKIEKTLSERDKQVHNRARNIAYDQTRKAFQNLNAGRMRAAGVKKYTWLHSGAGQKPREYHQKVLNGQVFDLDDPPIIDPNTGERGIPGQLINCRCTMLPIVEFNDGEEVL